MIICNGNKIHDLAYDVTRHWIHLKGGIKMAEMSWLKSDLKVAYKWLKGICH